MAEFQEVAKMYGRLCESYDECYKCPMFRNKNDQIACRYWTLIVDPKTAEEVILHWGKEHPVKTNRMKFNEVFGINLDSIEVVCRDGEGKVSHYQDVSAWLDKEYKEEHHD